MSVIPLLAASRHDLPRRARAQDDLRRLPGRRARAAPPSRRFRFEDPDHLDELLQRRARPDPPRLHGRREQHDRQRARPARVRRGRARARRAALRRRRARLRRHRRARAGRDLARTATRGNSVVRHFGETYDEPRARRRLLEGVLVAAGVHRLPDRGQEPAEGRRAAVPVLGPVAGRVARHRARRLRRQRDARRRSCAPSSGGSPTRVLERAATARRPHAEPLRASRSSRSRSRDHERHRRGRPLAVRPRHLRDARRLPARAQARGRLPRPGHRRQHRRRDRPADRGARGAGRSAASCGRRDAEAEREAA